MPHYATMYRIAATICRSSDDAADAVQDTVMKLWEKRNQLVDAENWGAYCATAVKHQCISILRKQKDSTDISNAGHLATESQASDTAEISAEISILNRIIETLPENQQSVVRLSSFACCTNSEIAETTGLSEANVRTLLSRARRRIRELFQSNI